MRGNRAIHRRGPDRAGRARSRRDFDFRYHVSASGARRGRRNRAAASANCRKQISRGARSRKMAPFWSRRNVERLPRIRESICARTSEPVRRRGRRCSNWIESAGSIFLGDLERAIVRRLRQRHESRAADRRRGAHARRAFGFGLREMHQRAGSFARGSAAARAGGRGIRTRRRA